MSHYPPQQRTITTKIPQIAMWIVWSPRNGYLKKIQRFSWWILIVDLNTNPQIWVKIGPSQGKMVQLAHTLGCAPQDASQSPTFMRLGDLKNYKPQESWEGGKTTQFIAIWCGKFLSKSSRFEVRRIKTTPRKCTSILLKPINWI